MSTKEESQQVSEWGLASTWKMLSFSFGYLLGTAIGGATFALFYYYEVEVGLDVALLALAFMIYGIYNIFNDPIFGYLTDKPFKWTRKYGMRFPWLMIGLFPAIIFYFLTFTVPETFIGQTDQWPLFWYLLIMLCLMDTFYSIFLPHLHGGVANHFRTEYERRKFSAINNTIPGILSLPLALIVPLIAVYGKRETFILAALVGISGWIFFAILFIPGARESEQLKESFIRGYESTTKTFWKTMKTGLGRKNFAISLIVLAIITLAGSLYYASHIYFMKDILRLPLTFFIIPILTYAVGIWIGVPIWTRFAKKKGFKKTYQLGLFMMACSYLPVLWITTIEETALFAFIGGFVSSCGIIMYVPIVSDCYDDVATVTGSRDEATLQGIRNFFFRIASVLFGPIIAIIHIMYGYNPDPYAVQTPEAIWGIRVHMGLIPMIINLIAAFIVWKWYDLEGEKKQAVIAKLKEMGL